MKVVEKEISKENDYAFSYETNKQFNCCKNDKCKLIIKIENKGKKDWKEHVFIQSANKNVNHNEIMQLVQVNSGEKT